MWWQRWHDYIIKLAQKEYETKHDWMCKKLKVDHATKWYTHKHESVQENEVHKILWDFK